LTIPDGSGNLAGVPRKLRVEYPGAIYHAHGNDDDIEVDRPTVEDGSGRSCGQLFEEKRMNSKANICSFAGLTPLLWSSR
jgi:hypothetical protein